MNDSPAQSGLATPAPSKPAFVAFVARNATWLTLLPFVLVSLAIVVAKNHDRQIGMANLKLIKGRVGGNRPLAIEGLKTLIRMAPSRELDSRRQLGEVYVEIKDYAHALEQYKAVNALLKGKGFEDQIMACEFELGRLDEARALRDLVLKNDPGNPPANYYLAKGLTREGKYAEAAQKLRLVILDERWNKRAMALRQEMAQKVFEQGVPVTPASAARTVLRPVTSAAPGSPPSAAAGKDGASSASRALKGASRHVMTPSSKTTAPAPRAH